MTVDKFNLIINILILFFIVFIYCSFLIKKEHTKVERKGKNSFTHTVFEAFFGKDEKITEEEKRDREILDMIERYDGKSVRRKEE